MQSGTAGSCCCICMRAISSCFSLRHSSCERFPERARTNARSIHPKYTSRVSILSSRVHRVAESSRNSTYRKLWLYQRRSSLHGSPSLVSVGDRRSHYRNVLFLLDQTATVPTFPSFFILKFALLLLFPFSYHSGSCNTVWWLRMYFRKIC